MPILTRFGGGAELKLRVRGVSVLPDSGKENEIAVITETPIPRFAIAAENPFLRTVESSDLLAGVTLTAGSITSLGNIAEQNATNLELYTEDTIPVTYGTNYTVTCTLASKKNLYLYITEYAGDTFVQRIAQINNVSNTTQTTTYTPSQETVTAVRISFYTYGLEHTVTFVSPSYVVTDAAEGTVWITAGESSVPFYLDRKQTLRMDPAAVLQYAGGTWVNRAAWIHRGDTWVQFSLDMLKLYWDGAENETYGGITGRHITKNETYISLRATGASEQNVRTTDPVDVSRYKTLCAEVSVPNTQQITLVAALRASATEGSATAAQYKELLSSKNGVPTFRVNIEDIGGNYYPVVYAEGYGITWYVHKLWLE